MEAEAAEDSRLQEEEEARLRIVAEAAEDRLALRPDPARQGRRYLQADQAAVPDVDGTNSR